MRAIGNDGDGSVHVGRIVGEVVGFRLSGHSQRRVTFVVQALDIEDVGVVSSDLDLITVAIPKQNQDVFYTAIDGRHFQDQTYTPRFVVGFGVIVIEKIEKRRSRVDHVDGLETRFRSFKTVAMGVFVHGDRRHRSGSIAIARPGIGICDAIGSDIPPLAPVGNRPLHRGNIFRIYL